MNRFCKYFTRLRGLLFLFGLLLLTLASPSYSAEPEMTDQAITDAIEDELLYDNAVSSYRIDVTTDNGIVTLAGEVSNILAKERAARIAETVKGVRSVVNRISVMPSTIHADSTIETEIEAALASDPATEAWEIQVAVNDGVVTLSGTVESWEEKQLAAKVAKGVAGVTELKNQIQIDYKVTRPDSEIKADIEQALRWDTLIDQALIDVEVSDGKVTLTGTVGSAAEKSRAWSTAWVSGVMNVENSGLEVARWARDEDLRQDKYVVKSSDDIREAIDAALLKHPRVSPFNVTTDVAGSTVTLRGLVDNLQAKRAAAQVARHTVGVRRVTNRIKVRHEPRKDSKIETSLRRAIENDSYLESREITVNVVGGVARLYGKVDTSYEKIHAENLAERVYGVDQVRNYLSVGYDSFFTYDPYVDEYYLNDYDSYELDSVYTAETDAEIKEDVVDELYWSPYVNAEDVEVTVDDAVVTLTGTVDSWLERDKAAENAWEGGARWVDNDLTVK